MTDATSNELDDWVVQCSDDDNISECNESWEPPAEEIESIYSLIEKGGPYHLSWQSPGYRAPSPKTPTSTPDQKMPVELQAEEKSDFDFMDEMSSPSLRVRREGEAELKGSAKKKTAKFDGILNNMRRHWIMDQMEKDKPQNDTLES